jgi:pyruvate/2-oxoglutarate dehydrogenase complex dihydrolipoamide acyltransferase (E2) component
VTPINVPKLGMTVTEATLAAWLVEDGAHVSEGQVICTLEMDKTEQDLEAPVAGTLVHRATVGEVYQVGHNLAEIV